MSQSSLNGKLIQGFGMLMGISVSLFMLRGLGIITFLPGGVITLLFSGAIVMAIFSYCARRWWRF
ncbi:hypothetical protein PN471_05470 [Aphanizomenon sp. CS-733/32]|uniref:hypothetical protein n=1 Tax=Aphanizomenon sp. CS-733/32 TaxID=3021715 RepID=UPI00232A7B2B|nr:hypothetical protein [Aphanizomenon sp. CS-733/32]MDB9308098.1 hypothetical protein [Aphanizomenon sp. CS-733/32]